MRQPAELIGILPGATLQESTRNKKLESVMESRLLRESASDFRPEKKTKTYYERLVLKDQLVNLDGEDDDEGGAVSYMLWLPVLLSIRALNLWLGFLTKPLFFIMETATGKKVRNVSFWDTSLRNRKQTAAVAFFVLMLPLAMMFNLTLLTLIVFPLTTLQALSYVAFMYFDASPENGSRRPFARYWKMWRHFSDYFPITLIKAADLDQDKSYVLCYHPHGIISMGAFGCFGIHSTGFHSTGFHKKYPGIDIRLLTLVTNFYIPFYREIMLALGICGASNKSCDNILKRNQGKGNAVLLVVGGAQESLDAKPGTYRLTLSRKGFVKVALRNCSQLVPVLGFGETDVFDSYVYDESSWIRRFQVGFKKKLGFAPPLFHGRGIFNYNMGFLPYRRPIFTVVGRPVCFPADYRAGEEVTDEMVNKYHKEYVKALMELYDAFKNQWAANRSESLRIIDSKRKRSEKSVKRQEQKSGQN